MARSEYVERQGFIEHKKGRDRKAEKVLVPATSTEAVNVDCERCGCTSVVNGSLTRTPPDPECTCNCHATWRMAQRGTTT